MALTVDKLLSDARTLISRLKEQDTNTDSIMSTSQVLHTRIEAMKQYQDDITELNKMAKHRPRSSLVMGLAQENRRIRELQQEKQELQMALEEHQSALQLIMHKYRQHTVRLLHANRLDATIAQRQVRSKEEACRLLTKVEEMACVMQQAVRLDDGDTLRNQARITRLQAENQSLRQLLEICSVGDGPAAPATPGGVTSPSDDLPPDTSSLDSSCCSQLSVVEVNIPSAAMDEGEEEEEEEEEKERGGDGDGGGGAGEGEDVKGEGDSGGQC